MKSFSMKKYSVVWSNLTACLFLLFQFNTYSQNIGIGTNNPKARLHIADSSVLFSASSVLPVTPHDPPVSGAGTRMLWYPDKAALRAGTVLGPHWDRDNVGNYSFAVGYNVAALAPTSIALGRVCTATGDESVAIGRNSVAFGAQSISMGETCVADGISAIAIGSDALSTADYSVAIGKNVTASGNYSTALGSYASTSNFEGSIAIGDHSTTTVMESFVANGFRSRFAGGYRLFTNSAVTVGAFLNANANSWAALSDVRMKENFLPVDGESFLQKIAAIPQYSWNYIGQDVKTLRHYGPMAQDFYAAFGNDDLGEIGCDTMINQQDFLGVNLIAIQALEKRTTQLSNENAMLLRRIELQDEQIKRLLQLLEEKRK
jgi:hypothetical protein